MVVANELTDNSMKQNRNSKNKPKHVCLICDKGGITSQYRKVWTIQ